METRKITSALKKAEDLLESERLRWQQKKSSLLEEMEKSRVLCVAQLDEQKHKSDNLVAALRSVNSHRLGWRQEKTSLIQAIEDLKKTLQLEKEDAQASHQAQLEEHRVETRKITSVLKKAENLLETERLCWQQEKSSLLEETEKSRAQLDEQKHKNNTLVAALSNVEQELQGHQEEWQKSKTSLIQTTEDLRKTLQEKEQKWEEKESQRTKKKKWFQKLFSRRDPH